MKFAWIENNRVRDIAPGNPAECYHPDVAKFYTTQVPDNASNGDGWVDDKLVKPVPPAPVPPTTPPRTWTAADIRAGLTLVERVKWDNDSSDTIKTAKIEMDAPQQLAHTTEVLNMLVAAGDISKASMDKVLA